MCPDGRSEREDEMQDLSARREPHVAETTVIIVIIVIMTTMLIKVVL